MSYHRCEVLNCGIFLIYNTKVVSSTRWNSLRAFHTAVVFTVADTCISRVARPTDLLVCRSAYIYLPPTGDCPDYCVQCLFQYYFVFLNWWSHCWYSLLWWPRVLRHCTATTRLLFLHVNVNVSGFGSRWNTSEGIKRLMVLDSSTVSEKQCRNSSCSNSGNFDSCLHSIRHGNYFDRIRLGSHRHIWNIIKIPKLNISVLLLEWICWM